MRKTKLNIVGHSSTATKKAEIQALLRLIGVWRDGGCILRNLRHCGGEAMVEDGKIISNVVIQYDHLITRANSATFADSRLGVCICNGCHMWKKYHENEYNDLLRHNILDAKTIQLWDKCEQDRRAHKTYKLDLSLAIVALTQELKTYE